MQTLTQWMPAELKAGALGGARGWPGGGAGVGAGVGGRSGVWCVVAQPRGAVDHLAGVEGWGRGWGAQVVRVADDVDEWELGAAMVGGCGVVVVSDLVSPVCLGALRAAGARGWRTCLMMDGLMEWRNVFENGSCGEGFLRPAPVDVVLCAGESDAERLRELGNRAVATGLPRWEGLRAGWAERVASGGMWGGEADGPVVVVTANRAWMSEAERGVVLGVLERVAGACVVAGREVVWRVGAEVARGLGVRAAAGGLGEVLGGAGAVVSLPSSVVGESMLMGLPTVLVEPFGVPGWMRAGWVSGGEDVEGLRAVVESACGRGEGPWVRQRGCVERMVQTRRPAAEMVGDVVASLACEVGGAAWGGASGRDVRGRGGRRRVAEASELVCEMAAWERGDVGEGDRGGGLGEAGLGRVRVVVTTHRGIVGPGVWETERAGLAEVVVVDPSGGHAAAVRRVGRELARIARERGAERVVCGGCDAAEVGLRWWLASEGVDAGGVGVSWRFGGDGDGGGGSGWCADVGLSDLRHWRLAWRGASESEVAEGRELLAAHAGVRAEEVAVDGPTRGVGGGVVMMVREMDEGLVEEVGAWRRDGWRVGYGLRLIEPAWVRLLTMVRWLKGAGCERVAVYGAGSQTWRARRALAGGEVAAVLDDRAGAGAGRVEGVEVVSPERAVELGIEGVVLSSDSYEGLLWARSEGLRAAGVRVVGLHGLSRGSSTGGVPVRRAA